MKACKNTHYFDVCFSVTTSHEDWQKVPAAELLAAMQRRLDYLKAHPGEVLEACGFVDSDE